MIQWPTAIGERKGEAITDQPHSPSEPQHSAARSAPAGELAEPFAVKRSVVRVLTLSIVSLGAYTLYWFYVTRKQLTRELGSDDNSGLQTLGLLVPILNIFITYWLWRDINRARVSVGLEEFPIGVYLVLSLIGLAFIFYPLVVMNLNQYWDRRTQGRATAAPFTLAEGVVGLGPGVISVLLMVVGIVLFAAGGGAGGGGSAY